MQKCQGKCCGSTVWWQWEHRAGAVAAESALCRGSGSRGSTVRGQWQQRQHRGGAPVAVLCGATLVQHHVLIMCGGAPVAVLCAVDHHVWGGTSGSAVWCYPGTASCAPSFQDLVGQPAALGNPWLWPWLWLQLKQRQPQAVAQANPVCCRGYGRSHGVEATLGLWLTPPQLGFAEAPHGLGHSIVHRSGQSPATPARSCRARAFSETCTLARHRRSLTRVLQGQRHTPTPARPPPLHAPSAHAPAPGDKLATRAAAACTSRRTFLPSPCPAAAHAHTMVASLSMGRASAPTRFRSWRLQALKARGTLAWGGPACRLHRASKACVVHLRPVCSCWKRAGWPAACTEHAAFACVQIHYNLQLLEALQVTLCLCVHQPAACK